MVVCPIAIVAGCEKCPAFKVCPMTTILGDQKSANDKGESGSKSADKPSAAKKKS